MNAGTINTIASVIGMINPAIGVISSIVSGLSGAGSNTESKFAKVAGQVQDAANVVTSLAPLVQGFANGEDVTPDQVRDALAGMDAQLAEFDRQIASKS